MEDLKKLMPLFTAIIAFCAFLALLLISFNSILDAKIDPINRNLENHLPTKFRDMETRIEGLEIQVKDLKDGQAELKEMIKALQPASR